MLIASIKPINRRIKIFIPHERNEEEKKTAVLDYGASEFVLKPLSQETMIQKAYRLLA